MVCHMTRFEEIDIFLYFLSHVKRVNESDNHETIETVITYVIRLFIRFNRSPL